MKSGIKTYNSQEFRKEYFNVGPELSQLFNNSLEDFFCLKIEDLIERGVRPIKPSREESHTIIFVTHGEYKTKIGFKEYTISAGTAVIIQAGAVFSATELSREVRGYVCHFHPSVLMGKLGNLPLILEFDFLAVGNYPLVAFSGVPKGHILNLLRRLLKEFRSSSTSDSRIIKSYLYALLAELGTLYNKPKVSLSNAQSKITAEFRFMAQRNVKQNLRVSDYAQKMNISTNHLNKCVKNITGVSASEVLQEIRHIEAKYQLYQSDLSVSQIAYEMGYQDPSYFTRLFKKKEGISPSRFKEMIDKC